MPKSHEVFIFPVLESESMQYRISSPGIFFDSSNHDGVEWVNLTSEPLEVALPDDICEPDTGKNQRKFKAKRVEIPTAASGGGKRAEIDFNDTGADKSAPEGVHSYTITGKVTKLKVIGHSDPRIIIY